MRSKRLFRFSLFCVLWLVIQIVLCPFIANTNYLVALNLAYNVLLIFHESFTPACITHTHWNFWALQNWVLVYLWNDLCGISFDWLIAGLSMNVFTELKLELESNIQCMLCDMILCNYYRWDAYALKKRLCISDFCVMNSSTSIFNSSFFPISGEFTLLMIRHYLKSMRVC